MPQSDTTLNPAPLSVFISYSHRDEDFKDELVVHLANLKRQGKICAWQDRDIEAGAEWDAEIQQQLESAEIVLLLITPRFLASDYCFDLEMQRAVERHNEGSARVIPIIIKPCDWQGTPFSKLQVVPKDAKPVTKWDDQDEAFLDVVKGIRRAVESLQAKKPSGTATVKQSTVEKPARFAPSIYNPSTWVERIEMTKRLLDTLQGSCRVLALVGITGIGKTALAERLVAELPHPSDTFVGAHGCALLPDIKPFRRVNLDEGGITPDFASSGAALLRSLGEEPTVEDQKDPKNLLNHILNALTESPCRLQIDSMERLLRGNDEEGWSEFCDPLWLNLFQRVLTAGDCQSQIILTTQDIPENLAYEGSRYDALWHCEPIRGLNEAEQLELFAKRGVVEIPPAPLDKGGAEGGGIEASTVVSYLQRIGRIYDGHPLVLRVIAEDIKTCGGDVVRYWQQCRFDDLEAHKPTRFSRRKLQREVERRVKITLESLPDDALQLLCRASVYRRPVPKAFWLGLMPDLDPEQGDALLDLLESRGFATEDWEPGAWLGADGEIPLRQHNLIRNVAYSLLQADKPNWETAHRQAADLWLTVYEPVDDVPNLEKVRGFIEAFQHYIAVDDWGNAEKIFTNPIDNFSHVPLPRQLEFWSYYQEGIKLCELILNKSTRAVDSVCLRLLGNYYLHLANYDQATSFYQQSLLAAREISDRFGESAALCNLGLAHTRLGNYKLAIEYLQQDLAISRELGDTKGISMTLGNLGLAYYSLGQYERAIDFHQQSLTIAREIGDRQGEGKALGNLGLAYDSLGQYERAIDFYQQYLTIAREIGDRLGEGNALGSLGGAYYSLGQYERAIDFHQQYLTIAREIGDRLGEGAALGNLGLAYDSLGQYERAIDFHQQHLGIAREIGDRRGEGNSLGNLGVTQLKLKQYSEALSNLTTVLAIFRELGGRNGEAEVLKGLAELHQALGEVETARQYGQQALALATELGIPLKAECETLLAELNQDRKS
ncbi:MAG: tetratricopeptide repeat protein [Elainellaceae cyanobacterium]